MNSVVKNRKKFATGMTLVATAITLASAAASYSINLKSFSDWPIAAARVLALFATIGTEATFALLLYGISNALSGLLEKSIAVGGLISLILVMATNFVVHRQMVTGASLSDWEVAWATYAGSAVLFGILALVVGLSMASYEARERRMQRDIEFTTTQKGLEWKRDILESPELVAYLNQSKPFVFDDVRRGLQLSPIGSNLMPVEVSRPTSIDKVND